MVTSTTKPRCNRCNSQEFRIRIYNNVNPPMLKLLCKCGMPYGTAYIIDRIREEKHDRKKKGA